MIRRGDTTEEELIAQGLMRAKCVLAPGPLAGELQKRKAMKNGQVDSSEEKTDGLEGEGKPEGRRSGAGRKGKVKG